MYGKELLQQESIVQNPVHMWLHSSFFCGLIWSAILRFMHSSISSATVNSLSSFFRIFKIFMFLFSFASCLLYFAERLAAFNFTCRLFLFNCSLIFFNACWTRSKNFRIFISQAYPFLDDVMMRDCEYVKFLN